MVDSKRTLQEITDISLQEGTFKSLNLDEIKQFGQKLTIVLVRLRAYGTMGGSKQCCLFISLNSV